MRRILALVTAAALLAGCSETPSPTGSGDYHPEPILKDAVIPDYDLSRDGKSYWDSTYVKPYDEVAERLDDNGILVNMYQDQRVYHPVNYVWYLQNVINAYANTGDERYLKIAVDNTEYLLAGSFYDLSGARWFPYLFEHAPGGIDMGVPWVSGMAQGMMLSLLTRMYEITDDKGYLDRAAETLKIFDVPAYEQTFWFSNLIDCPETKGQCLVLEEYPSRKPEQNAHVINGHMYSMFGLYDYYRATGDEHAKELFNAAAETQRQLFDSYRRPGEPSWYAATEYGREVWKAPENYHEGVTVELRKLAEYTGDEEFTRQADLLSEDFGGR
ncbi:MAG: D-glucuronyl C5-epimerase family protein [Flaviflexus sp.]|nr:D-glucuronyl C5-epimerase family protein [Flaviflexus sp.]